MSEEKEPDDYNTMSLEELQGKLDWFAAKTRQLRAILKGRLAIEEAQKGRMKVRHTRTRL